MRLHFPPASSYYAASSPEGANPRRETLQGERRADVGVIGGGIAGCSAALHLAKRGYRVALLEARSVGYGASGRSGGQVIFGLAASQKALAAQVGAEDARRLFDLSIEALDLTQSLIRDYRIDCDYRPNHVHVATKPRHLRELAEWVHELRHDYGYESARLLDRDELQAHVRSERYLGGLIDSRSGHLHPLKYTQGLARAAEAAGVRIFENTQALDYEEGRELMVRTAHGALRCAQLVLCGNAYLGSFAPVLARRILGVGTYIIATQPLDPERARALLPSDAAIADVNWILDYFRRSADHRILFGGRVSYSAFEPPRLAESMRRRMVRVFPAGCRRQGAVHVGRVPGHHHEPRARFRPACSQCVLPAGIFRPRHVPDGAGRQAGGRGGRWNGGALRCICAPAAPRLPRRAAARRPSLVLAMLYYRLRDML